jgi:hypothetical protein
MQNLLKGRLDTYDQNHASLVVSILKKTTNGLSVLLEGIG